jgi:hypothetical protein
VLRYIFEEPRKFVNPVIMKSVWNGAANDSVPSRATTFRATPTAAILANWTSQTPEKFRFTLKATK